MAEAAGASGAGGKSSDALVFLLRQALQSGGTVLLKVNACLSTHFREVISISQYMNIEIYVFSCSSIELY